MPCGCTYQPLATVSTSERAAMCLSCPDSSGTVYCTVNGRKMRENIADNACPLGRFPDAMGQTEWLGTKWVGVPAPIRWASRTWLGRKILRLHKPLPEMPGCGCLVEGLKVYHTIRNRTSSAS